MFCSTKERLLFDIAGGLLCGDVSISMSLISVSESSRCFFNVKSLSRGEEAGCFPATPLLRRSGVLSEHCWSERSVNTSNLFEVGSVKLTFLVHSVDWGGLFDEGLCRFLFR